MNVELSIPPAPYEAVSSMTFSAYFGRRRIAQDERKHFNGFATALQSKVMCLGVTDSQHISEQTATDVILPPTWPWHQHGPILMQDMRRPQSCGSVS